MIRGSIVLITSLLSVIFLKRKLKFHHYVGLVLVLTGVFIVGITCWLKDSSDGKINPLGIFLLLGSQLFIGANYVLEEKIFEKYSIHPMKLIGYEGLWASIMCIILLVVLQFIDCSGSLCQNGHFDDVKLIIQ